jgi:hypothetical protein
MKLECVEKYTKNGCNIQASPDRYLLVINYWEDVKRHPSYSSFNRPSSVYDPLDNARKTAAEILAGKEYMTMLDMPDLVISYKLPAIPSKFRTRRDLFKMGKAAMIIEYVRTSCPVTFDASFDELVDMIIAWQEEKSE